MTTTPSPDVNMPILVIDDLPTMRRVVKNCLRQLGFENVTEAASGSEALEKLRAQPFGLIISDWTIPEIPEHHLVSAVRSEAGTAEVPLLVVAAEAQRPSLSILSTEEHVSWIIKPFTASLLEQKMREALSPLEP